jgi:hypothetical protein
MGHITNGTDIDEEKYWGYHRVYHYDKDQDCGDDVNDVAILYVAMI